MIVVGISTPAGYYLSRFDFKGRPSYLKGLLVLHAFPAMTLIIPIFLMMYWIGLLDTLTGVILIIAALELPFAIFVMKGFFDAVPWDIEMSAMTDGASRRQAFWMVVDSEVRSHVAIAVFGSPRWKSRVRCPSCVEVDCESLSLFWMRDDVMAGLCDVSERGVLRAAEWLPTLSSEIPTSDYCRRKG